ncbi:hypothetical protein D3C80_1039530 [compost metagenome]
MPRPEGGYGLAMLTYEVLVAEPQPDQHEEHAANGCGLLDRSRRGPGRALHGLGNSLSPDSGLAERLSDGAGDGAICVFTGAITTVE